MRAKNVTFEPLGLNNRTDPIDLTPFEMVVAENIDLRRGRSARRRKGGTQVAAGKFYSFWDNGKTAYVGKDTGGIYTLNEFLGDFSTRELTTLGTGNPLSFEQVNATTVVSDGLSIGFIENGAFIAPVAPTARDMRALVAGEILTSQNGRLLIAKQRSLYYTIAYDLEAMDRRDCQIPLPEVLTMAVGLGTGIWISYQGVISFIAGAGPDEYQFDQKANYTAIRGTAKRTQASLFGADLTGEAVIFMTNRGVCLGTEQGQLLALTEEQISTGAGEYGAGFVRESDGYVHYVGAIQDPESAYNAYAPKAINLNAWRAAVVLPLLTSSQP